MLLSAPGADALRDIIQRHKACSVFPPLGSERWEQAFAAPALGEIYDSIIARAQAEASTPMPELTDALYRDYAQTGVRHRFESVYFLRRRLLSWAAFALLAQPRQALGGGSALRTVFLNRLESVLDEVSWAFPAHMPIENETGRDPLVIDLFSAETADMLANAVQIFAQIIPDSLQQRIRTRLRREVFENYCKNAASAQPFFWLNTSSNWNAVCHQGVIGAALAIEEDAGLLAQMLTHAARHLPVFLSGFGTDGGCSEGPTYWEYGFGFFCNLNEHIELRTGGELSLIEGDARIDAIARYGAIVSLSERKLVNFADSPNEQILSPALMQYLAGRLGSAACALQAEENYAEQIRQGLNLQANNRQLRALARFFLEYPKGQKAPAQKEPVLKEDAYLPDLAVWIVRGHDAKGHLWEVAAKGGHNEEHHNHNDVGSFIANVDGTALLIELGAPAYDRDFFRPEHRYFYLAARSLGHSLPVINGSEQAEGRAHAASVTEASVQADAVRFSADLAAAYPPAARCVRFVRTLELDKAAGRLVLADAVELEDAGNIESAFITDAPVVQIESPRRAIIEKEGKRLVLELEAGARWDRIEHHPHILHRREKVMVHRLVARLSATENRFKMVCAMTLADA